MNKLLFIIGPTATGKTDLALRLARKFKGEIIAADSRQVYRGMDVGTGKDIPREFRIKNLELRINQDKKEIRLYSNGNINIWGLDIVNPDEEFAVSEYVRYVIPVFEEIWRNKKLPIIVGGTGLYIRVLRTPLPEIFIPQNKKLRRILYSCHIETLQEKLKSVNSEKYASMNNSDKNNSRRLIRAIEIESWRESDDDNQRNNIINQYLQFLKSFDKLVIGLKADQTIINEKIDRRVEARVKQGIIEEIKKLIDSGCKWHFPSMSSIGYREWREYVENLKFNPSTGSGLTLSEVERVKIQNSKFDSLRKNAIEKWKLHEKKYAKRQMTWFKKENGIIWFDISDSNYQRAVLAEVEKWYNYK